MESLKSQGLVQKYLLLNPIRTQEKGFDDFELLKEFKKYRVCEVKIFWKTTQYIKGVQFAYEVELPNGSVTKIDGQKMILVPVDKSIKVLTISLEKGEYITEIFGRKGLVLDMLGFKTNKGKANSIGGNGGGEFTLKAPEGFHLACFGGCVGDCDNSLSTLTCDIQEIPDLGVEKKKSTLSLSSWKPIVRSLMDFLDVKDFCRLFLLNRDFSKLRYDNYIMGTFGRKLIYTVHNQNRRYLKLILEKTLFNDSLTTELRAILQKSHNKIEDPYGAKNFLGWTVENGGNGWAVHEGYTQKFRDKCFVSSYGMCHLKKEFTFQELLSKEEQQEFVEKQVILAFGAFIGQSGFGGQGSLKLEIFNTSDVKIFSKSLGKNDLRMEYDKLALKFSYDDVKELPHLFKFTVSGKDTCYWAGHYGARFSGIFIRVLPKDDHLIKFI